MDSIVYAGNEYSFWFAVRADGQGDVTQTHLLWKAEENLPDLCSPLATAEYVFLLASWGMLTCYDAKNGEKPRELELEASFISSPGMAGECLYVIGEKQQDTADGERTETGICWVIRPGREGGEISRRESSRRRLHGKPGFQGWQAISPRTKALDVYRRSRSNDSTPLTGNRPQAEEIEAVVADSGMNLTAGLLAQDLAGSSCGWEPVPGTEAAGRNAFPTGCKPSAAARRVVRATTSNDASIGIGAERKRIVA